MAQLRIADRTFNSRLFTGTGKYASAAQLRAVLDACGAEVVTMAIKRVRFDAKDDGILSALDPKKHLILPNTSGVRTAKEAIFAAELAREALGTSWLNIHADPVLAKRLEEVGAAAVMPLGAPIGSNRGLLSRDFLRIIIEQARVPVIIDAGLGAPSHAAEALEMGADAVLVNTAIASSGDPIAMAQAFRLADQAHPTSPLTGFLD
ncbi:MAG: thiazole synthase [Verrucomicrobia bacterium]|nr:thiazole synthase [Verrucomicrobiota bacterium]